MRGWQQLLHLVGLCADVGLCVFETRDGAVTEAAHHRHQCVEVLQLQQLLWMEMEEILGVRVKEETVYAYVFVSARKHSKERTRVKGWRRLKKIHEESERCRKQK